MTDRNPDHPLGSFRNRWPGGWWQQVHYDDAGNPRGAPFGTLEHDDSKSVDLDDTCSECEARVPVVVFSEEYPYESPKIKVCASCLRRLADLLDTGIPPIVAAIAERQAEEDRLWALEREAEEEEERRWAAEK